MRVVILVSESECNSAKTTALREDMAKAIIVSVSARRGAPVLSEPIAITVNRETNGLEVAKTAIHHAGHDPAGPRGPLHAETIYPGYDGNGEIVTV